MPRTWPPGPGCARVTTSPRGSTARPAPQGQRAPAVPPGRVRMVRGAPRRLPEVSLPPARDEMGRVPQQARQEEGHHGRRPRDDRDHLARPGHRQALRRARRRLLRPPPTPNARYPASSPDSKPSAATSPWKKPPDPAPARRPRRCITGRGLLPPAQLRPIHVSAISPNDFASLDELAGTLLAFVDRYNQTARPFNWKFTAADLARLLDRISAHEHAAQNLAELPEAA